MKNILTSIAFLLGFFLALPFLFAAECGQTPTSHCTLSVSTTFAPGTYAEVENLTVIANRTVVDCNGAVFTSTTGQSLFHVGGTQGGTIKVRDGNTRLYGAMQYDVPPASIPAMAMAAQILRMDVLP